MKPERLSWVTVPLRLFTLLSVLGLLLLPFLGALLNLILGAVLGDASTTAEDAQIISWVRLFTGSTLWVLFFIGLAWTVFEYLTYRAVVAGLAWGRVAAIVIAVVGLLNFPFGTLLGVFLLIGAFDPAVQRYAAG
ncbi:hypothetical protein DKM44_01500 [Deinococcus irradiatisoli]|uniref:Uncharacterized protein n=1 Tax=Deinococcus irradiatisoli TaxID=2202254 RepID=A0A2Z3JAD5_9DEIO|nr:hypothetical protein [Deinococcus irradiatisoli]AWN22077.1 hypothetical protein DKM44_01500 [Deinococcus irradiatisoli]